MRSFSKRPQLLRVSTFLQAAGCALRSHVSFGFVYSEGKLAPCDYTAEILGVVVGLGEASRKNLSISNKPSRLKELDRALRECLEPGVVIPNQLPSVLGKLQYADLHVWGRTGKLALAGLRELGHTAPTQCDWIAIRLGRSNFFKNDCAGDAEILLCR